MMQGKAEIGFHLRSVPYLRLLVLGPLTRRFLEWSPQSTFFVRHFALAGKVVIIDEVHSYDLYTGTLIDKLITTLEGLGCTVIVLSATLTRKRRGQIIAFGNDSQDDESIRAYL